MDAYDEIHELNFFTRPSTDPPPSSAEWATPARQLRDAIERLSLIDLWSRPGYDALVAAGLDFGTGYFWGRGAALGGAEPAVIAAAFAVFEPGMVIGQIEAARQIADLDQVRAAKLAGAQAGLRAALGEPPELADVSAALRRGAEAGQTAGRALYAGLRSQPWPEQPAAQLWHAINLLREYRGDTHVAACVAAGLDAVSMNVLTERWVGYPAGTYSGTRGWSAVDIAAAYDRLRGAGWLEGDDLSAVGRVRREELERRTDEGVADAVAAIGADLPEVLRLCQQWSATVVAHGSVPSDPYKAAAG
jgi:hypothetical protein